ncbi:MAG TPA: hypothetical protein VMW29_01305 [Candidatus Bathyarchaeia archaeon]|nr:hypothetical protein [Candidatus Bathyarchaeia archaeon]
MVDNKPVARETRLPPPPEVVVRAQKLSIEIQPWYWEFGSEIHDFYRETEREMEQTATNVALLVGDVRCGKTVERVKWEAEDPDRVVGYNLEDHGSSTDHEIVSNILKTIGKRKPEVLILDEVGYVKDRFQNVIDELTERLPDIKIMAVLPVRLDEGQEAAEELAALVGERKGLIKTFPATWSEEEIGRYFQRRCELQKFSFDEEAQNQLSLILHYLSMGIPKSVDLATTKLFTYLSTREGIPLDKLNNIFILGLAYYINPNLELVAPQLDTEIPLEAVEAASCFADISSTLYELVLKQMPGKRFQERKKQQERLGAWYMVQPFLKERGIIVKKPQYEGVPILRPKAVETPPSVDVQKVIDHLIVKMIEQGQCVTLVDFPTADMERIVRALIAKINQPIIHLDLADILQQDVEMQTSAFRAQLAKQLKVGVDSLTNPYDIREALENAQISLIILENVEECIQKQLTIHNRTNGNLRALTLQRPMLSLGDIGEVPASEDVLSSPLFNVFEPLRSAYFKLT